MVKNESKKIQKITNVIQENHTWVIALIAILGAFCLNISKFTEFLQAKVTFSYYGLDMGLYKYNDLNFFYEFCLSLIIISVFISMLCCGKQIRDNIKNKKYLNKTNGNNILTLFVSNIVLLFTTGAKLNWIGYFFNSVFLIIIEIFISYIVFKEPSEKIQTLKEFFVDLCKKVPFLLVFLILYFCIVTYANISSKKEYRIINDNTVIVYSNNDYFLALDCEVNDDILIIHKGTQNKIVNTNVYSKLKKFDEIKVE